VEKIMEIDEHIGCAMSGLIADARTLVEHARVETQVHSSVIYILFTCLRALSVKSDLICYNNQNHRFSYGEPMTVESSTQAICDLALRFGEGDEESMVSLILCYYNLQNTRSKINYLQITFHSLNFKI
jgi:20S proteasome subunit alpha 5